MASQTIDPHFLHISEVLNRFGVSRPTIYRWVAADDFPKQIQLGSCSVVWLEYYVTKWTVDQMAAR